MLPGDGLEGVDTGVALEAPLPHPEGGPVVEAPGTGEGGIRGAEELFGPRREGLFLCF